MKKTFFIMLYIILSGEAYSDAICHGKIKELTKWSANWSRDLSISIEGTDQNGAFVTPFLQLKDKTYQSMALSAFAAQSDITVKMIGSQYTNCSNGWEHYTEINGYLTVRK